MCSHDSPENASDRSSELRRDAILSAIAYAGQQFLRSGDWNATVDAALARLGQAAEVDRVFVFENHTNRAGKAVASLRHEWVALPGRRLLTSPGLQDTPYFTNSTLQWQEQLRQGEIVAGKMDDFSPAFRKVLRLLLVRSFAAVPIFVAGAWWGALGFVESHSDREWSESELDALRVAASLLGAAFERQAIGQERAESERFWALMSRLSAASLEAVDEATLLATTVDQLADVIRADHCLVLLWNAVSETVIPAAATQQVRQILPFFGKTVPPGLLMNRILQERSTLVYGDTRKLEPSYQNHLHGIAAASGLAVPMIAQNQVLGAVLLGFSEPHVITTLEKERSELATQQLAHFLFNARLLAAETQARQRAETLRAVGQVISSSLNLHEVLERVLSELQKVVAYDSASVQRLEGNQSVIVAARGLDDSVAAIGLAFDIWNTNQPNHAIYRDKRSLILADVALDFSGFDAIIAPIGRIRSWMGVPLLFGDRAVGMLTLDKHEPDYYTPEHARTAEAFGAQAAIALENARLFGVTRQLNARIWRQAEQLRQIIETMPDGIAVLDSQNAILLANQAFYAQLPWLVGSSHAANLNQLCGRPITWYVETDSAVGWHEVPSVAGSHRLFTISVTPINFGQGAEGLVVMSADVTADREQRDQQRANERLAVAGALAFGIAHDFNNILQGIIGFADLLSKNAEIPIKARDRLALMAREGERGAELIRLIVEHSRVVALDPRPLELAPLVNHAVQGLGPESERVRVQASVAGPLWPVIGDPVRLTEALTGLLADALRCVAPDAAVTVHLHNQILPAGQASGAPIARADRWVVVEIVGGDRWFTSAEEVNALQNDFPLIHADAARNVMLTRVQVAVRQHRGLIGIHHSASACTVTLSLPASVAGETPDTYDETDWESP